MRGTLHKRSEGVWRLFADAPRTPDGRRQQKTRTVKGTKKEAEQALAAFIVEIAGNQPTVTKGTLNELLGEWLELGDLRPGTRVRVKAMLDKHVTPSVGQVPLRKLTARDLDRFYQSLELAPATVLRLHTSISSALSRGVKWGMLVSNPATAASPPRPKPKRPTAPNLEQVQALLKVADGPFHVFLTLAATTGARRGELCGLRWDTIDGDEMLITRTIMRIGKELAVQPTKSGRSRTIVLPLPAVIALKRYRALVAADCLAVGVELGGYVFSHDLGARPWGPDWVTSQFIDLRNRVGVDCRLHDLRHFTATQLLANGVEVGTVSRQLGHARTSTTLDVYDGGTDAGAVRAAEVMGELWG